MTYFRDETVTLHHGDALEVLRELPTESVDCCVTSPPYFGLRDYGVDGQYGLEASPADYVETMRALFAEVRRVLTAGGTLWLNIGDSYSVGSSARHNTNQPNKNRDGSADNTFDVFGATFTPSRERHGIPAKNMLGIPWRVAFALQDDGWILRNDIIWNKPNAMPESIQDRLSCRHEHVFMLTKSRQYWFDLDPIREQYSGERDLSRRARTGRTNKENSVAVPWPPIGGTKNAGTASTRSGNVAEAASGRNPGDVWTLPTQPFAEAHFAVMPVALAERAILSGCKPGGVVLDPFSGSGTTGLAAAKHGHRYVGIDINAEYLDLSLSTRLAQTALLDGEPA